MKTTPALTAVLDVLNRQQEHDQALAKLDAAMAVQQKIIDDAAVDHAAVDQLQRQLEDALAQTAAGETPAAQPEVLAEQLRKARADWEKAQAGATVQSDLAQQTLAGLARRREALSDQVMDHALNDALKAFVISEQDAAGHAYIAASNALVNAYARIQALQAMANRHSPPLNRVGPPPFLHELDLIKRPQNMALPEPVAYAASQPDVLFSHPNLRALVETTHLALVTELREVGLPF
ncbi:MAG: hypothetical protein KDI73_02065 [Candidatus Competibacteraceae bacterium]|nr:hypothetical protein [Candidatus Competibacteraceae bacterium]